MLQIATELSNAMNTQVVLVEPGKGLLTEADAKLEEAQVVNPGVRPAPPA